MLIWALCQVLCVKSNGVDPLQEIYQRFNFAYACGHCGHTRGFRHHQRGPGSGRGLVAGETTSLPPARWIRNCLVLVL